MTINRIKFLHKYLDLEFIVDFRSLLLRCVSEPATLCLQALTLPTLKLLFIQNFKTSDIG